MPSPLSEVRLLDTATCRYVVFVEHEPDAYTDDESGGLIGSGLGSWIGNSETAIGGNEVLGTRRVRPGLIVPETVTFEIEPKTGELAPSPATFEILDVDDTLSYLFASEGKDYVELGERIAPGTSALGTSVVLYDGVSTTNPRGRYIGPERIGPSGQRRFCPALPFSLVGFDHAVGEHLPAVLISDEPIDFAGRMVTLYRIYKVRPELDDSDPDAWATWDEAHAAGDLVWWGVLRDAGNVGGNNIWSIECHGPDALTRRTLGTLNTSRWMPITAEPTTSAEERLVAIGFTSKAGSPTDEADNAAPDQHFDYRAFDTDYPFTGTTRAALADELNGWIEETLAGTDTVAGADGDFASWVDITGSVNPDAGVTSEGVFFIKRDAGTADMLEQGRMFVCMHRDYWRMLGWDPALQDRDATIFSDYALADFKLCEAGEPVTFHGFITGANAPASDYWIAMFATVAPGFDQQGTTTEGWDNDGAPREWYPMHTAAVFELRPDAQQVVRLTGETTGSLRLEGQPIAGIEVDGVQIDGSDVEHGRWFVIRGDKVVVQDDPSTDEVELSDAKKVFLVAKGEWVEGANYGNVSEGDGISPAIRLAYREYPRAWGWDNDRNISLAGKVSGKGLVEIAPLHAYHYERYTRPFEIAPLTWLQVMLSTGTATGYDAAHDAGGVFTGGANQPASAFTFLDSELADMGLGIPYQIVASPDEVVAAFDTVPGGATGALCRGKYAYLGPYQAAEVLQSLMRPRLLCWSLAGKQFGLFRLGPVSAEDVDMEITEDDLYGLTEDPTSVIPGQTLRATGQLDRVDLAYRMDAATGKTALEASYPALDAGARTRTGELVESVTEHGLCPPWFGDQQEAITGVGNWSEQFRQLWSRDAAEFFARRHYMLEMTLARPKGQDAMPGTSVAITNPWPVNPRGGRGITGATGRLIGVTQNLREHTATVRAIVFAGQPVVHYSPAVLVGQVVGTSVTWYDYTDVDADGRGFVEPDWSTTGGEMQVDFYQRTGTTWAQVFSAGVVSVDLATRTAVLDAAPGTAILRDKDTWMVARSWSNQHANEWPRALYGVQADSDQTVGDASTKAPAFVV